MYLFEESVARAAKSAGMRAVVGEVLYDFPSPNYGPLKNGFRYVSQMLEKWGDDPLVNVAIEPHSTYLCSPDLLLEAADMAWSNNVPLVLHLAETDSEVQQVIQSYGCRPVEHLQSLGLLKSNLVACHAVKVNQDEIMMLAEGRVKVAHNAESNMKLASGVAPVPEMVSAGVCVGLGTDGCCSNNDLDLFREMDSVAKLHKVFKGDPTVLPALRVLQMATIDAARSLGLEQRVGSLAVGKQADIVVLDASKAHSVPTFDPVSHLVYNADGSDVLHVVIDGMVVCENRQLQTIDLNEIVGRVREIAKDFRPFANNGSNRL